MTALTFALDPVDVAVLDLLRAPGNLSVHVGSVGDSDDNAKTVSAPLPYLLYGSTVGAGASERLAGWQGRVVTFTTTYTNSTLDGCKAVALAVRGYLDGSPVTIAGVGRRIHLSDPTQPVYVERDQVWRRPDGSPLFFAVDRWLVRA